MSGPPVAAMGKAANKTEAELALEKKYELLRKKRVRCQCPLRPSAPSAPYALVILSVPCRPRLLHPPGRSGLQADVGRQGAAKLSSHWALASGRRCLPCTCHASDFAADPDPLATPLGDGPGSNPNPSGLALDADPCPIFG